MPGTTPQRIDHEQRPWTGLGALLLATLITAAPAATALDPATPFRDYALRHYGVAQGLPQISVLSVTQDARGYLWVGTQGGVARFDGLRFVTFDRARGGVDTTLASTALVDARDRVWFGTPRGAVVLESGAVRELRARDALLTVNALALDATGETLFATERGVLRAEGDALVPHLLAGTAAHALLRDRAGLWVGTNGALIHVEGGANERLALPDPAARVTRLVLEGAALVIGTDRGAWRFDPATRRFDGPLAGVDPVESLLIDRHGNLWLGSTSLLRRIAPDGRIDEIPAEVLDGKPWVNALFEDRDGDLWIGTRRESLYRVSDTALRMRSLRDGLADPLVWSVIADGDGVLVGTNTSFHRLSAEGRFSAVTARGALPQATVNTFARDADDGLWVGTRGGVTRFARGAYTMPPELASLAGKQVTAIVQVGPDDRWIATLDGLYRHRGGELIAVMPGAGTAATKVRYLLARGADEVWIGTEDGLRVVRDGVVARPEWAAPLDGMFVTHLIALPDGRVVIGTLDSGLAVQRGARMVRVGRNEGLPSLNAWTMDLVEGWLFVGSLDGIWRLRIASLPEPGGDGGSGRVTAEVVAGSGYRDSSVRGFACCNGGAVSRSARLGRFLFYPSTEGVVRLDTGAIRPAPPAPAAVIEALTHGGALRHSDRPFTIKGEDRDLNIEYSAVTFVRAFALEFRYRLEGYDADWIEAGERRTAFYTHLPHGEFRFVVEARTPNGEWGAPSTPLELQITPLWHERLVVKIAALLLAALLLALVWRDRIARLRARQAALEAAVAERTRELARTNERLRVANQTLALENQTDPLTGLYNRRFILSHALRGGAARASDRSAVLLLELDDFKWVNETHGFASGDRVLVELGGLLSRSVRGGDVVARWSGVEFLLLLPGLDESGTLELAERTRVRVAAHEFRSEDESPLRLSITIGFAHHVPDESGSGGGIEPTLDLADAALQRAKRMGRNRVTGVRRLSRELPARMQPTEIEGLITEGRLVWVEPGAG